jgi:hypothetical protein
MKVDRFSPVFVEFIPAQPATGDLYISIPYATSTHLCACGCGERVVTPLTPTDWKLIFDGETVSLSPSIGNWSFSCQSHYWIRGNRVAWAPKWSRHQIELNRANDRHLKSRTYAELDGVQHAQPEQIERPWWRRLLGR